MSIFFTSEARACCKFCRHELPAYSMSGHCPSCGRWYAVERGTIAPGRLRAVALVHKSRPVILGKVSSAWTGIAATALILGNAAILIFIARMAMKTFWRACGMSGW